MTTNKNLLFEQNLYVIRAIAILSVVLFHLGFLKNGYFGVDCFFVLSGFLISHTFKNKKSFDYIFEFYQKRLSRIVIPTLSCILLTLLISFFILNSFQYEKILQLSKSFTLFYFNFVDYNNYFSNNFNSEKLLVHLWSICVEIQFYMLFPLIILFSYKYRIICLTIFIILSLVLIVFGGNLSSSPPFFDSSLDFNKTPGFINHYHILGRLWEFCTGILLSLTINSISLSKNKYIYLYVFSIIILFTSFAFSVFENKNPDFKNIFPVISTLGLIMCAKKIKFSLSTILIPIGKRAFSIYLVHQPIFFGYLFYIGYLSEINYFDYTIIILFIYLATIIFFKFIEIPSLRMKNIKFPKIVTGLLLTLCFFSFLGVNSLIKTNIVEKLWNKNLDKTEKTIWNEIDNSIQSGLDKKFKVNKCNILSERLVEVLNTYNSCERNLRKRILIIGDSHAADLFYALDKNYKNYQILALSIPGCRFSKKSLSSKVCKEIEQLPTFIRDNDLKFYKVLLKISGYYMTIDHSYTRRAKNYFQELLEINSNTFWIGPNLEPVFTPRVFNPKIHDLNLLNNFDRKIFAKIKTLDQDLSKKYKDKFISLIQNIHLVNMPNIVNAKNLPYYSDTDHWNFKGESYYGKIIGTLLLLNG